jgi:hypothetical protein
MSHAYDTIDPFASEAHQAFDEIGLLLGSLWRLSVVGAHNSARRRLPSNPESAF